MTDTSRQSPACPSTGAPAPVPPGPAGRPLPRWAAPAALGGVLVLAAALYGWSLNSLGWGNSYYAAAAESMGRNWSNFLFGAYDPVGVLTVDKPPAALWPQVASTKLFGMHGWATILPQLLEGVAAVLLLHRTVRRWAGEGAALLAALVLTLTPITVAINRDNNPDTLLVLTLVAAAYALTRALQASSAGGRAAVWWLAGAGFLVGVGFLTKMLAAWMVLPAFTAAWLAGSAGPWLIRVRRLLIAGAVLLVSSLWWVVMVALWPGERPYVGGSENGTAWDLVLGYNGLGRVFGADGPGGGGGFGAGGFFGGEPGLGRLFNDQVAGQISWLLPLCGMALCVAVAVAVLRRRGSAGSGDPLAASGWILWGTWLVVCGLVFALQEGTFHPYYTTQLAPAVAALTAGLATALVRAHRAGGRWALPVGTGTVLVTVLWAVTVIRREPDWHGWLAWPVVLAGLGAAALLLLSHVRRRLLPPRPGRYRARRTAGTGHLGRHRSGQPLGHGRRQPHGGACDGRVLRGGGHPAAAPVPENSGPPRGWNRPRAWNARKASARPPAGSPGAGPRPGCGPASGPGPGPVRPGRRRRRRRRRARQRQRTGRRRRARQRQPGPATAPVPAAARASAAGPASAAPCRSPPTSARSWTTRSSTPAAPRSAWPSRAGPTPPPRSS
ncbi:hypothetical protein GCM10020295_01620 [Streptomyces cinereospinus]